MEVTASTAAAPSAIVWEVPMEWGALGQPTSSRGGVCVGWSIANWVVRSWCSLPQRPRLVLLVGLATAPSAPSETYRNTALTPVDHAPKAKRGGAGQAPAGRSSPAAIPTPPRTARPSVLGRRRIRCLGKHLLALLEAARSCSFAHSPIGYPAAAAAGE